MAARDWALTSVKPTLDAESCYEQHPINWNFENGCMDDHDTRRAVYSALMAGACGHTYGHINMWIFHRPEEDLPELRRMEMPHNLHWKDELDSPGNVGHAVGISASTQQRLSCIPYITVRRSAACCALFGAYVATANQPRAA